MVRNMLFDDKLIVVGLATLSLGTIKESDGVQQHSFWLRNDAQYSITLMQGYTSCGCTTVDFSKGSAVLPGDSTIVTLRFNPAGKSGEFLETATVTYVPTDSLDLIPANRHYRTQMTFEGVCIASDESLRRQFPVTINNHLSASASRFDIGVMKVGAKRTVHVSVLHHGKNNRESFPITFEVTDKTQKGLQHIERTITIMDGKKKVPFSITLDVMVK